MSIPVPSPSMYGMIGWSGTFRDMSALTVIFWPWLGTLMCWYMEGRNSGEMKWARSPGQPDDSSPLRGRRQNGASPACVTRRLSTDQHRLAFPKGFPGTGGAFRKSSIQRNSDHDQAARRPGDRLLRNRFVRAD